MSRIYTYVCIVATAASAIFCGSILFRSSGVHELWTEGANVFDAGNLVRQRALFGLFISAVALAAITLTQLSKKHSSQIMGVCFALVLMSMLGLALSVDTYRQFI